MKLTQIWIYPTNSTGKQVVEERIEGNENLLRKMFFTYFKHLDRLKISYIFKTEGMGTKDETSFHYNLTKDELANAEKFIPNFKK